MLKNEVVTIGDIGDAIADEKTWRWHNRATALLQTGRQYYLRGVFHIKT